MRRRARYTSPKTAGALRATLEKARGWIADLNNIEIYGREGAKILLVEIDAVLKGEVGG